ncbi:tetratricopeptide repeat protein [Ramlibacter sp. MMS24-I3-19]|uniref:tetratricopeptide repeat protein n=1 Tax=Ramlibacter sp. MMS24-I3-19 TaxID=3416606 RepID=UPI003D030DF8
MKTRHWIAWAISLALLFALPNLVWAQAEPTLDQIYQAANAGQLPKAQGMIDQVLRTHPDSAKAHYVKAELSARQHDAAAARQELATAERLAPGLPFAKPGAAQALRTQVEHLGSAPSQDVTRQMGASARPDAPQPAAARGLPWGTLALGAAILVGLVALMRRRNRPLASGYGSGPMGSGPAQGPMTNAGYGPGMQPPGYGPGYGPYGGYPQQGMGSGIGRGLATGLAVGAGAVAASEIGRRMFHPDGSQVMPDASSTGSAWTGDAGAMDNADMGGQDFGVNDAGSWDSGGGMDSGDVGGGDWN